MDTNRLRYFCTVVQTENLHRASELLHISAPALSKSLKVLEQDLGVSLITQIGRGITITDEGRMVYEKAKKVLKEVEGLYSWELEDLQKDLLKIGSFEVFSTYFVGPLFKEEFKDRSCELHEFIPGKLEQALVDGVIDLGVTYIPIPHPLLDHLKITSLEMGLFANNSQFEKMDFDQLPFSVPITPIEGSPNKTRGLDGWPDDKLPRLQKYKVTMMESALELCRQGLAVGFFPKFVIALHNQKVKKNVELKELSLPEKFPKKSLRQDVYLVKRKSDVEGKDAKKLGRILRKIV